MTFAKKQVGYSPPVMSSSPVDLNFMKLKILICLIAMTLNTNSFANSTTEKKLPACPSSPNCVSSQANDTEHFIAPYKIKGDINQAWSELKRILLLQSRIVITDESADTLHAQATSLVFRFVDDIDVILDADAKLFHIRSASRVGYSDLGVNRKRMETLRSQLQLAQVIE